MCQWLGRKSQDDKGHSEERLHNCVLEDTEAATMWKNLPIDNSESKVTQDSCVLNALKIP